MDFDGVNSIVCDAEETDWLDVSYSERNYVDDQPKQKNKPHIKFKLSKPLKIAAIALLCAALLAALLFVDGQFAKDVFETAKAAFSSTVFTDRETDATAPSVAIPRKYDLVDVADGVATFNGGKAALSFTAGKVVATGDNSVTVEMDDNTDIVYNNLTDIFVKTGDVVSVNSLLARYDGSFTVTVMVNDTAVDVVGSETQLTWNV